MLIEQLNQDLKEAMRARDKVRLRTIRLLRAALLEKEIAERRGGKAEKAPQRPAKETSAGNFEPARTVLVFAHAHL
ncbi:MAG: GatB/YqeY domain-containing protein, partial [Bacteroidetes bacterium]|nr:GatB/YqeY domain-containing protein [Bacteroidota bacterium]